MTRIPRNSLLPPLAAVGLLLGCSPTDSPVGTKDSGSTSASAPEYTVVRDLTAQLGGTLDVNYLYLNDSNQIAGNYTLPGSSTPIPFYWTRTQLTRLDQSVITPCTFVYDMNNRHDFACGNPDSPGGVMILLPGGYHQLVQGLATGGPYTNVTVKINDSGAVAGVLTSAACPTGCVFRLVGDSIKVIHSRVLMYAAKEMNNRGDLLVTGFRRSSQGGSGDDFLFVAGVDTAIDHRVGGWGGLESVNDNGTVVGSVVGTDPADSNYYGPLAVVRPLGQATTVLGAGVATSINNAGVVVGTLGDGRPFAWKGGQFKYLGGTLDDASWTWILPLTINNSGAMLVVADDSVSWKIGHVLLVTPRNQ